MTISVSTLLNINLKIQFYIKHHAEFIKYLLLIHLAECKEH